MESNFAVVSKSLNSYGEYDVEVIIMHIKVCENIVLVNEASVHLPAQSS